MKEIEDLERAMAIKDFDELTRKTIVTSLEGAASIVRHMTKRIEEFESLNAELIDGISVLRAFIEATSRFSPDSFELTSILNFADMLIAGAKAYSARRSNSPPHAPED